VFLIPFFIPVIAHHNPSQIVHTNPIWGAYNSVNLNLSSGFEKFSSEFVKFTLSQWPQIGPQIGFVCTMLLGLWWAITGIKNEIKSTIRSSYSFLGSALMKILKKVVGHLIFGHPIWSRDGSKMTFFNFRHTLSCKI